MKSSWRVFSWSQMPGVTGSACFVLTYLTYAPTYLTYDTNLACNLSTTGCSQAIVRPIL